MRAATACAKATGARVRRRWWRAAAAITAALLATAPAVGQSPGAGRETAIDLGELAPRYQQWLISVQGLITREEVDYFLGLPQDYQRDAFMEAFWEPRDPDPATRRNELRERWQEALASAGGLPYGDPRFVLYLLNGPPGGYSLPNGRPVARCFSRSRELEIWFYGGSERTDRRFLVIFYKRSGGAPYETYRPGDAVRPTPRIGRLPTTDLQSLCADELLGWAAREIGRSPGYVRLLEQVLTPPLPTAEWLANLRLGGTELPAGTETFAVATDIDFPARRQSRTAVRMLLRVPRDEAPGRSFGGEPFHHFELSGEVVRDGRLFESFAYRFEGPTPAGSDEIPLGFTRYLRPGPVTLRVLLQDVFSGRAAQIVRELQVPPPDGLPAAPDPATAAAIAGPAPAAEGGDPTLRLLTPPPGPLAGPQRFTARAEGEFDKVVFYLDERPVFTLRRPPWSAELNLGPAPAPHRVRVAGFAGGSEVATDQIWLNQGGLRFQVRLVEPRPGGIYPGSLTARIEVETPDGQPPERVELWLDDALVATFTEPPLERSLRLAGPEPAVVRAAAYLADGSAAEDAVLVNAAGLTETIDVRLVELEVQVVDGAGRPLTDLEPDEIRIFEDGVPQQLERFERPGQPALDVALLIDRSASMADRLSPVVTAAEALVDAALGSPGTRVAVLSFADRLTVDAPFSDVAADAERALAGLTARGGTALWDGLAEAFTAFQGGPGQKLLVLFSDGQDEDSQLGSEQLLEAALRARATLWAVALAEGFPDRAARRDLERLCAATGGEAVLLEGLDELAAAYDRILRDGRSRYLLTYQSTSTRPAGELRELRVEVDRPGAQATTRSGYYP